jgi:sterol desaturase/sphingolipid hydroxylase (fatty acid hydroxylase superfamily)
MAIPQWLITFGVSILFLAIAFIPMEKAFPANKNQKIFRPHWLTDLLFFLGQFLLWNGLVFSLLNYFNTWLHGIIPANFRTAVAAQPFLLQAAEVIILSDVCIYWAHRLQHQIPFLWRFHKVHHSAEHLDWLAAYREHPLDTIYTVGLINLPAFMLGFPLETLTGVIAFRGIWAVYIHSNVRFRLGPLKKIIGSPELHHWHHARDQYAGNYANISPMMDILFGTYVCPDHEPEHLGIKEQFPKNYFGQLLAPILPDKWIQRWPMLLKKREKQS